MEKLTLKVHSSGEATPFWEMLVLPILKYKKIIYAVVASSVLTSFVACLLLKNQYTSTAVILPTGNSSLTSDLKDLAVGSLSDLNIGAANQGSENSSALFPNILQSRLLSEKILKNRFSFYDNSNPKNITLEDYIDAANFDRALENLRKLFQVDADRKTGIITLSVTTHYPELSAAVIHAYLEELDDYNIHHRQSSASENEKFTSKRLAEIKSELGAAEDTLRSFKDSNLNYSTGNDPELQLELSRLQREVDLKATIYLTMAQQNEMAKIEAVKDIPIIQVLDKGQVPLEKSSPKRSMIIAGAFIGSLFFSILLALWLDLSVKRGLNGSFKKVISSPEIRMNRLETNIATRLTRIADLIGKKEDNKNLTL